VSKVWAFWDAVIDTRAAALSDPSGEVLTQVPSRFGNLSNLISASFSRCRRSVLGLDPPSRRDLPEIIEDRSERGLALVGGQLASDGWRQAIGAPTLADTIRDARRHASPRTTR
jgi:hypothetical protein